MVRKTIGQNRTPSHTGSVLASSYGDSHPSSEPTVSAVWLVTGCFIISFKFLSYLVVKKHYDGFEDYATIVQEAVSRITVSLVKSSME